MRRLIGLAAAAVLCGSGAVAHGQVSAPTTVQLPTFHVFTVQTTVSVPDRGSSPLGGITRGADGRVQLGPLGNRASSSSRGAAGVSATATILDNRELDEAVLAAAALPIAARNEANERASAKGVELARTVARTASVAMPGSVAAIRASQAAEDQERNAELQGWLAKGQQAAARGEGKLAQTYFRLVAKRGTGDVKQRAESLLEAATRR